MKKGAGIRWNPARSAADNAAEKLPQLVAAYFSAGRKMTAEPALPDELHQFRIRSKRLRYTLELFRPCYGPVMDRRLESLRRIQQCLGEMNDFATIRELVDEPEIVAGLDRLVEAKAKEFAALWRNEFDREGAESRWIRYMSRPNRPEPGRRPV